MLNADQPDNGPRNHQLITQTRMAETGVLLLAELVDTAGGVPACAAPAAQSPS